MRRHLERHGCRAEEIESAVELLGEQGYLDDARFARLFVEDKRRLEQWGCERIRRTLSQRGIGVELVEEALAAGGPDGEIARAAGGPDGEITRAVGLLRRRFPKPPRERRERDRALGVLLRKGYTSEVALEALVAYADCADSFPVLRCQ